jgi:hypothetical protein
MQTLRYTDGLLKSTSDIVSLHLQNECAIFSQKQLHTLLEELVKVPTIAGKNRVVSQLFFQHANIYVKEGNLSKTMALLDQAYNNSSVISIPLYQAWLLGSAGLYKDAIEYLEIAEQADRKRRVFAPSRINEISALKRQYLQKLR